MISEGEYFFRGAMRISWGFATPNYLGAFLAALLPLAWGARALLPQATRAVPTPAVNPRKRPKDTPSPMPVRKGLLAGSCVLFLIELALWGAIGATGSRGAALAALAGVVWWELFRRLRAERSWRTSAGWIGLRVLFCVGGFAVFSFGGRIAPGYLAQDASIGNRWLLWGGGAALCEAAPWRGWGAGESGELFTQWLQPLDRPEAYKTMVNSYLHLAVEHGLPALAGVLAVLAGLVCWPLVAERSLGSARWAAVCRTAACVWVAWATANVFSTLFDDRRLWFAPAGALLAVLVSVPVVLKGQRSWRRWAMGVLAGATILPLLVYLVGVFWQWRAAVRVRCSESGMVALSSGWGETSSRWGVLPDPAVLGEKYGHEIRRWGMAMNDQSWSARVHDPRRGALGVAGEALPNQWLVFGSGVGDLDQLGDNTFVVIVHPRGALPKKWRGNGLLLLNQIDEDGSGAAWAGWADALGLRSHTISGIGLDVRAAWPDAYLSRLRGGAR